MEDLPCTPVEETVERRDPVVEDLLKMDDLLPSLQEPLAATPVTTPPIQSASESLIQELLSEPVTGEFFWYNLN